MPRLWCFSLLAWRHHDALYYASYFADRTFNPFIPYPIVAGYFIYQVSLGCGG